MENRMELFDYKLSNNFIFDYYIYYNQSDLVFTSNTVYRYSTFYSSVYSYDGMSAEEWRSLMTGKYYRNETLPAQPMTVGGKPHRMITYLQSIGLGFVPRGTVVVLIDEREVQKLLGGLVGSGEGWAYIADPSGRIISSVSRHPEGLVPIDIPQETRGQIRRSVNGSDMMITFTTSDYNGWKYMVVHPTSVVLNKVNYIQKITFTCVALSLLAGILIAYFLAYRNSKPLKTIIAKVMDQFGGEPHQPGNAYRIIEKTLLRLANNNDELERRIREQIPLLQLTYIEQLLKGDFTSEKEIVHRLQQTGVELAGRYYTVLIVQFAFSGRMDNGKDDSFDKERVLIKEALHNALQSRGFLHDLDNDKIAVVYASDAENVPQCKRDVVTVMEKTALLLSIQLHIRTQAAAGGIYENVADISRSFKEARIALNRVQVRDGNAILWYDEIPQEYNSYYYPAELERRILNLVRAGDEPETLRLMDQLYAENFVNRQLSLPILRLFLSDLAGSLLKQAELLERVNPRLSDDIDGLLARMEAYDDPVAIFEHVRKLHADLCREFYERKKSKNEDLNLNFESPLFR